MGQSLFKDIPKELSAAILQQRLHPRVISDIDSKTIQLLPSLQLYPATNYDLPPDTNDKSRFCPHSAIELSTLERNCVTATPGFK